MKKKFRLSYGHSDGRSADLELCVFCQRVGELNEIGKCEYYADGYADNSCVAFVQVDNVEARILEALDIKLWQDKVSNITGGVHERISCDSN